MTAAVALWTRLQMNSNELKHPTLGREFPQKMGTCCLASPKMLTQWIVEKKTVAMIIISFYIPLPISICTISSISAIVACILTTYITPPTIIEVWNEHVIYVIYIYIIGLRVFGGFGSQGGAYWNRWYRYPSRSRPFHPESQYVASTRRGLAATSPQPHILNTPGPFNLYLRK